MLLLIAETSFALYCLSLCLRIVCVLVIYLLSALLATLMKDIIVVLGLITFFALTLSLRMLPVSLPLNWVIFCPTISHYFLPYLLNALVLLKQSHVPLLTLS